MKNLKEKEKKFIEIYGKDRLNKLKENLVLKRNKSLLNKLNYWISLVKNSEDKFNV